MITEYLPDFRIDFPGHFCNDFANVAWGQNLGLEKGSYYNVGKSFGSGGGSEIHCRTECANLDGCLYFAATENSDAHYCEFAASCVNVLVSDQYDIFAV